MASPRWQTLEVLGARRQRPLWASTGVKDPSLPPTLYVMGLVVDGCVNTMPAATLQASAEYDGPVIDTVTGQVKKIPVGKEPHGLTVWPQPGRYSLGHTGNMR